MKNLFTVFLYIVICLSMSTSYSTASCSQQGYKKRILIASPVHQKPLILKEFLQSLQRLHAEDFAVDCYFIDDNDCQDASILLQQFISTASQASVLKKSTQVSNYVCNEITHYWNDALIEKVAQFKNSSIVHALEHDYDYLFLIDSDIVLHPETLRYLVDSGKDIISNIFWTQWRLDEQPLPQVWLYDVYTQYALNSKSEKPSHEEIIKRRTQFLEQLKEPGIYQVGGLGACTLISRHALKTGINFQDIKNVTFWGEDRHFCIRAAVLGIPLFVGTHYPAYHIYRESDLLGVTEYKRQIEQ